MTQREAIITPKEESSRQLFAAYMPRLVRVTGKDICFMEEVMAGDSFAYRFVLAAPDPRVPTVVVSDWDNTLWPCTKQTAATHDDWTATLVPTISPDARVLFCSACAALHSVSRVVPAHEKGPERYAPLLELAAVSQLCKHIQAHGADFFPAEAGGADAHQSLSSWAHHYLKTQILPLVQPTIVLRETVVDGQATTSFVETTPSTHFLRHKTRPAVIAAPIWDIFRSHMLTKQIPEEERSHFDLPADTRFIIVTFGLAPYQLEKVLVGMQEIQDFGGRLPDEIIAVEEGSKVPIIRELLSRFAEARFVCIDDRVDQLLGIAPSGRAVSVLARRPELIVRDPIPEDFYQIDMSITSLSTIARLAQ